MLTREELEQRIQELETQLKITTNTYEKLFADLQEHVDNCLQGRMTGFKGE